MSAYMVNKKHIDAIVSVVEKGPAGMAESPKHSWRDSMAWARIIPAHGPDQDGFSALGQLLVTENLHSIHARYPDTIIDPEATPGPIDNFWKEPYFYRRVKHQPTTVEALKLIDCYEYQASEHPEWEKSKARQICERLRSNLISVLPGYKEAPWQWDKD